MMTTLTTNKETFLCEFLGNEDIFDNKDLLHFFKTPPFVD